MKTLLTWCRYDPHEGGLPHINFRDRRTAALEQALVDAQSLAAAPPERAWVAQAWSIWRRLALIKGTRDDEQIGAASHTVRFISNSLGGVGHPAATPDAVSAELRGNPEYRKHLLQ
jgi:hypothetical protein